MITTPFVNHINDRIRLYVEKIGDEIIITDDGETINDGLRFFYPSSLGNY
ncbi:DUF1828 domain-containing protein [Lactococcus formosensis subsp. bovis]